MPTVLITGANRGLGLEFVRQYAADGWNVIAACRAPEQAEALKTLAQGVSAIRIEHVDVADNDSLAALVHRLEGVSLDLLINNAGIVSGLLPTTSSEFMFNEQAQRLGTLDSEAWARVLRVNTIAPAMATQALLPNLRLASTSKVVMISSRMGSLEAITSADNFAYRVSKTALNAVMRCTAAALQPESIAVISLNPGWVKTDMGTSSANLTPKESVSGMRQVIASLTMAQTGQFFRYTGETVPW